MPSPAVPTVPTADEANGLRDFERVLHEAIVEGAREECDGCPELKALLADIDAELAKARKKDSAAVRACVSKKIAKLMHEGKYETQAQAVAVAFAMCRKDPSAHEKALEGDEPDPEADAARRAAESAEAGGAADDITRRAVEIVAQALARAKGMGLSPQEAADRSRRAWEARHRRGERAQPAAPAAAPGTAPAVTPGGPPAASVPGQPSGPPPEPPGEAPPTPEAPPEAPPEVPAAAETAPRPTSPHKRAQVAAGSTRKVQAIMQRHGLRDESEEMEELAGFKSTLGQRGRGRTIDQLKRDFVANMDPSNYSSPKAFQSAQQRIRGMGAEDFGKVLASVHAEDEEEGAASAAPKPVGRPAAAPAAPAASPGGASVAASLPWREPILALPLRRILNRADPR